MVDPKLALLVFAVLVAVTLAAAWPRHGIWAKARRLWRVSDRVRLEDTLKYLFHRNAAGTAVHPDSLAGALGVGRPQARRLLARVADSGLAINTATGFRLTGDGRSEALRIVRSHRLLEQYFANHTSVSPAEWHDLAEEAEHELSPQDVERLARQLGQPRFDPHGDPIPTATGEMPAALGLSLANLDEGDAGTIVHLEDEPREDYERLIGLGLALGKQVVKRGPRGSEVALDLDGKRLMLPDDLLDAVNVERGESRTTRPARTLADLQRGESAIVTRVSTECRGAQRRRLLDLGVVPGTVISAEMLSPSGDPMAYRIRGALIALRQAHARWIEVEPAHSIAQQDVA